jgi:hypothetical protein
MTGCSGKGGDKEWELSFQNPKYPINIGKNA